MISAQSGNTGHAMSLSTSIIEEASQRRRAQLLSTLIRTLAPLGVFFVLVPNAIQSYLGTSHIRPVLYLIAMLILIATFSIVRLSRSKYHRLTAIMTIYTASAVTLIASVLVERPRGHEFALYYISIPVLLSSVFLSVRSAIGIAVINLVAMAGVALIFLNSIQEEIFVGPIRYIVVISVALIMAAHFRDLMEQDNMAVLSEQEMRYRGLFETVFEGLLVYNDGKIIDTNLHLSRKLGYATDDLVGKPLSAIIDPAVPVAQLLKSAEKSSIEAVLVRANGTHCDMELVARPVTLLGHTVTLIATRDITDRKLAAEQAVQIARQEERVNTLQEIIEYISHDFKTPLTTVNANLYLLRKMDVAGERTRYYDALQTASDRMVRMVDQVLTFSRLDLNKDSNLPDIDIHTAIDDELMRISTRASARNITIQKVFCDDPSTIRMSVDNLYDLVANLLNNALQFTGDGGNITVTTAVTGTHVIMEICDTGIGIAPDDLSRIFDKFYRVEKARPETGGSGLGLAIVQKIVEVHQGHIEVQSQPGHGSMFRVSLPLSQPTEAMPPQAG
ncbi:MAG: ATP-binding protein [Chloroflexi bacterium]|nr:ATP-binding protein [Chloroflexota bacterium]